MACEKNVKSCPIAARTAGANLSSMVNSATLSCCTKATTKEAVRKETSRERERIKALDGKIRDLERSRDKWKAEAKEARREVDTLRRQGGDASAKADDPSKVQTARAGRALIVAPSTGLVPTAATAAPPFCPRSTTAIR